MSAIKEKTHPDLANIDGTFSSVIEANSRVLANLINDDNVTVDEVKEFVFEIMENCKETPWIRRAKIKIDNMNDKRDLAFYIYNSVLSGANLKAS